jgi:hypothetical protein
MPFPIVTFSLYYSGLTYIQNNSLFKLKKSNLSIILGDQKDSDPIASSALLPAGSQLRSLPNWTLLLLSDDIIISDCWV